VRLLSLLQPPGQVFRLTENLFLRLLGVVYLIAFASLYPQIVGLVGANGISPAAGTLAAMHSDYGWRAYLDVPSLFWFFPLRRRAANDLPSRLPRRFASDARPRHAHRRRRCLRTLSLPHHRRPTVHRLPMGRTSTRNRFPRHLRRRHLAALRLPPIALPPHVRIGLRQTHLRRPQLAQSARPPLPLFHPTIAHPPSPTACSKRPAGCSTR
jgi:hypothetical protein